MADGVVAQAVTKDGSKRNQGNQLAGVKRHRHFSWGEVAAKRRGGHSCDNG